MASLNDAGVKELLNGRFIGTLGTHGPDGSVHMVAVWYGFDGSDIFVATSSRSRKARNVDENPKVSLMIDLAGRGGIAGDYGGRHGAGYSRRGIAEEKSGGSPKILECD